VFDPEFEWFDPKRIDKSTSLFSVHQRKVHVNSAEMVAIAIVILETFKRLNRFPRTSLSIEPRIDGT
jgi:hypothetical protein